MIIFLGIISIFISLLVILYITYKIFCVLFESIIEKTEKPSLNIVIFGKTYNFYLSICFMEFVLIFFFATIYYALENILKVEILKSSTNESFLRYLYFSVTTFTTTGYGDIYPVTPFGYSINILHQLIRLSELSTVLIKTGKMIGYIGNNTKNLNPDDNSSPPNPNSNLPDQDVKNQKFEDNEKEKINEIIDSLEFELQEIELTNKIKVENNRIRSWQRFNYEKYLYNENYVLKKSIEKIKEITKK